MVSRIVLTLGTFDLLHVGHLELLRESRSLSQGGKVVVGLNTDGFVERYKGQPCVQTYAERAEMLMACRYVDLVVANVGEQDSRTVIDVVRPDLLTIGDDWLTRDYLGQLGLTQDWLDERKLEIAYIPRTTGESTTRLRALLAS